jgi:hypothetical protein
MTTIKLNEANVKALEALKAHAGAALGALSAHYEREFNMILGSILESKGEDPAADWKFDADTNTFTKESKIVSL